MQAFSALSHGKNATLFEKDDTEGVTVFEQENKKRPDRPNAENQLSSARI